MASDSSTSNDFAAFNQFVTTQLGDDLAGLSLEESLAQFRAYQRDLESLRARLRTSEEQSARSESKALDEDAFWQRVNNRLDEKRIPE